jgi:hypothetical protein
MRIRSAAEKAPSSVCVWELPAPRFRAATPKRLVCPGAVQAQHESSRDRRAWRARDRRRRAQFVATHDAIKPTQDEQRVRRAPRPAGPRLAERARSRARVIRARHTEVRARHGGEHRLRGIVYGEWHCARRARRGEWHGRAHVQVRHPAFALQLDVRRLRVRGARREQHRAARVRDGEQPVTRCVQRLDV